MVPGGFGRGRVVRIDRQTEDRLQRAGAVVDDDTGDTDLPVLADRADGQVVADGQTPGSGQPDRSPDVSGGVSPAVSVERAVASVVYTTPYRLKSWFGCVSAT